MLEPVGLAELALEDPEELATEVADVVTLLPEVVLSAIGLTSIARAA